MKDMMDQWTKVMETMWSPWQQMMTEFPWSNASEMPFQGKWSTWFAAIRSNYDINVSWWQTFMEQSEEMFFKTFKDSPFYSSSLELQLRELYDGIKRAQSTQQDLVKTQLERMESLLREKEDK
jgi:hypothetical protein